MIVTEIIKRRGSIYEVRFDDGTYILLDKGFSEEKSIKKGMEISEEMSFQLEDASNLIRTKNRAFYYLTGRDMSKKELKDKLLKAGFPEKCVSACLEKTEDLGLIDDEKYARRLFERLSEQSLSKRAIKEKLKEKGIDKEIITLTLEKENISEEEKIKKLLLIKYRNKLFDEDSVKKVTAALLRRGFAFSNIRTVLKKYSSEIESGED